MSIQDDVPASLLAAIEHAIGGPVIALGSLERQPIVYDAFLAARSLHRVRGTASTTTGSRAWSLVEKVTKGPSVATTYLYDNGHREFRAYESDLLDDLAPGLAAPTPHGRAEGPDGRLTLWLEDLGDPRQRRSDREIPDAARHLGRLAGRWQGRVPDEPWLFSGWVDRHGQPEAIERDLVRLGSVRSAHSIAEQTGWSVADAIGLIELQTELRPVLEELPETLCHHDAVGANVFRRTGPSAETVLIDWEMVGPGPIGADLASLLFSSVRRGDLSAATLMRLRDPALRAYAEGIRDVGRDVDPVLIGIGFDAAVSLRWTLARDVALAIDEDGPIFRGSAIHESRGEALRELVALSRVLFDSAASVRRAIMSA